MNLDLDNFVSILGVLNLGGNLACFHVHASFEQGLSVVELVLCNVGVELCELIVVFSGFGVVLHIEEAIGQ